MDITAVVVVGRRATPVDALTEVGGFPMVVLAVRGLLATGLFGRVRLHDLGARSDELVSACAGLPVTVDGAEDDRPLGTGAHPGQRAPATSGDGSNTLRVKPARVIVLHDVARPLAPATLCAAVVDAVLAGHDMCVPVLPLSDTVKQVDGDGVVRATPDRAGLRVLQTPLAVRAELLPDGLAGDPLDHVRRYLAAGNSVHTVPGEPAAFAVRSAWDLELARQLAEGTIIR